MAGVDLSKKLEFLAKRYDIFECGEENDYSEKEEEYIESGHELIEPVISPHSGKVLAIRATKYKKGKYAKTSVSIEYHVFEKMILADPSERKEFLQWMLNVVNRNLKDGSVDDAIRFIEEDLTQATDYLKLFQENKKKKLFLEMASISYVLKDVKDRGDINQYRSLSQLFDAVDPFIKRDPSDIERAMERFVRSGKAEIPVRDRKYTVFIPKTREANVLFDKFSSWCTAKPKNGMFKSYTENNRTPQGTKSKIYIVIDNGFFEGKNKLIYQIHFETHQIRDRSQHVVDLYDKVLKHSEAVSNYFKDELIGCAKKSPNRLKNLYVDYLDRFKLSGEKIELFDDDTPYLFFKGQNIKDIKDISRFKDLNELIIIDCKMETLNESIGTLKNLAVLSIPKNKVREIPSWIGYCTNLVFMNLKGNHIDSIPETIANLDKSRGGSLEGVAINPSEIGEVNFNKLKSLLPKTEIIS
jgi:hypothetical protein